MACTSQSASEYIKSARTRLVGGLKNLSVIVENLYQRGVLTDEQVSEIKTEPNDYDKTRTILDLVTIKGEKASYELLKVIYITRKRTLERPVSEEVGSTSTRKSNSDLHHWISCFSFKDDVDMDINYFKGPRPCHKYQAKLKKKALKLSHEVWKQSKRFLQEDKYSNLSYIPLVLDTNKNKNAPYKNIKFKSKKCKKRRPKKMKSYIPVDKQEISVDYLLKTQENKILLVGKTGIGKTMAARQMLTIWGGRDNNDLDYMFYFDMTEMSHTTNPMSLEDLLFNMFSEPDDGKAEVLEDIKRNSENVTIILDGLTDLPPSSVIKRLVDGDLLPDAKIMITCRPEVESEDILLEWSAFRVEVKGFSTKSIREYLDKMLEAEQVSNILNSPELFSLCHVPVYALMVVACFSFTNFMAPQEPCTVTEIYMSILHGCIQKYSDKAIAKIGLERDHGEAIFSLAMAAFQATQEKSVNLTAQSSEESFVHSAFLSTLKVQVRPAVWKPYSAFLHYTIQEFFAGLWFLKNPDKVTDLLQQCCTEEMKHMKHLIPFLCGLFSEKTQDKFDWLAQDQQVKALSKSFIRDVIRTFLFSPLNQDQGDTDDSDILFLCQCLYESQSTEGCLHFLDKLDYCLDLSNNLDHHHYCAVSYVISQSQAKKIKLTLEDTVSEQGLGLILGCLKNVQLDGSYTLQCQLWKALLLSEGDMDYGCLLGLCGNELYLPVSCDKIQVFERAAKVMQNSPESVHLCLLWDRKTIVCQDLRQTLLESLPHIRSLRDPSGVAESPVQQHFLGLLEGEEKKLFLDLCLDAAIIKGEVLKSTAPEVWPIDLSKREASALLEYFKLQPEKKSVELRLSGWPNEDSEVKSFLLCLPYIVKLRFTSANQTGHRFLMNVCVQAALHDRLNTKTIEEVFLLSEYWNYKWDFLLDLYSHVKDYETQTQKSVLPALQPVYQSAPEVWSIDLSERKVSVLLEVLKVQQQRRPVELRGWSDEENEVKIFLQCLPYISNLRFTSENETGHRFLMNLCVQAALHDRLNIQTIEEVFSLSEYWKNYKWDFLLDLYSHVKEYETQAQKSVRPALQPVYQSAPEVWSIDLSERKVSVLLEVLKVQQQRRPVELRGWSDDENEVKIFLQCLPYISNLRFTHQRSELSKQSKFLGKLVFEATEREEETGEKFPELLTSVCNYKTFPFVDWYNANDVLDHMKYQCDVLDDMKYQCDLLLDLYSYVKMNQTQTGRRVLPALQPVYQSIPAVWFIDLSERKVSLLQEVLKLQPEKKPVELRVCSDEDSVLRLFLQCLPYISQLSFRFTDQRSEMSKQSTFLGKLICKAVQREEETGENVLGLFYSVCNYETFPFNDWYADWEDRTNQCDVLLDLYSYVKNYETETGRRVLPALQPVYQSVPAIWFIDLSERKVSLLQEVLKLQPEKKPVELRGWSDEEIVVRIFLQCLPYISKLRCDPGFFQHTCGTIDSSSTEEVEQLVSLLRLLDFTLLLRGQLCTNTCKAVGKVLQLCGPCVDLVLTPSKISLKGASLLFRHVTQIKSLRCDPGFFQHTCGTIDSSSTEEVEQLVSLLCLLDFTLLLRGQLCTNTCKAVGKVLQLCGPCVDLVLTPSKISLKGASLLFRHVTQIKSLRCDPGFFQHTCGTIDSSSTEEVEQLVSLLCLLDFTLLLRGQLCTNTCKAVGKVLQLCGPCVDLVLTPSKISLKGASLLFRHVTQIKSLRLSVSMVLQLFRSVRTGHLPHPVAVEVLSLQTTTEQSERLLSRVVSKVASLLRHWSVRCLDMTESNIHSYLLLPLLSHRGQLTIKLCPGVLQELAGVVYTALDEDLTTSFLDKVGET